MAPELAAIPAHAAGLTRLPDIPSPSADWLRAWAASPVPAVRAAVAAHETVPLDVLVRLAQDPHPVVHQTAHAVLATHPAVTNPPPAPPRRRSPSRVPAIPPSCQRLRTQIALDARGLRIVTATPVDDAALAQWVSDRLTGDPARFALEHWTIVGTADPATAHLEVVGRLADVPAAAPRASRRPAR